MKVLVVLHGLGGGTDKYAYDLIDALRDYCDFYPISVSGRVVTLREIKGETDIGYRFILPAKIGRSTFHDPVYRELLGKISDTFGINLVHVHHLLGHTLDVFDVAEERGIPVLVTLQDYYCACPAIFRSDERGIYCPTLSDTARCDRCCQARLNLPPGYIVRWREEFGNALQSSFGIIANDHVVIDAFRECYPIPEEKVRIIEPGHAGELIDYSQHRPERTLRHPARIGYIGVLQPHKGMHAFYALSGSAALREKVRWKVIGVVAVPGEDIPDTFEVCGRFRDYEELSRVLADLDIVINPGPSETWGYALSEAWAFGLPALVADTGVIAHRVEESGGGWIMDVNDIPSAEALILRIISDEGEYAGKVQAVRRIALNSMENFGNEYRSLYGSIPVDRVRVPDMGFTEEELAVASAAALGGPAPVIVEPGPDLPLHVRFFKCLRENGPGYTLVRVIAFLKE